MSTPHDNHSDKNYPEDGVTHYPNKGKTHGIGKKLTAQAKALKKAMGEVGGRFTKKEGMSAKELFGFSPVKREREHKKRLGLK